jgi:hypothetical protein
MVFSSASQYVDDKAEEESDGHNGEDNLDKYESDSSMTQNQQGMYFCALVLYKPNELTMFCREPTEWPDSPPRVDAEAADSDCDGVSNTGEQSASDKRVANKKSPGDSVNP